MQISIINHTDFITGAEECVVIVDVYLACSTIVTLFDRGVTKIIPAASIKEALAMKNGNRVLIGEDAGQKVPPGFDYLNSPGIIMHEDLSGKTVVFRSNNTTRAIERCGSRSIVLFGCMLNLSAVADKIRELHGIGEVTLAAIGRLNEEGPEDEICAGLLKMQIDSIPFNYLDYRSRIVNSPITGIVKRMCEDDIEYCARANISRTVPRLHVENGEKFILPV